MRYDGFDVKLGYSDASIEEVERILGLLHEDVARSEPSEKEIARMAHVFGCYVGEVYRRNHGATWGVVQMGEEKAIGLRTKAGTLFWPLVRVRTRIEDGPDNNVWHYYGALLEGEKK